jgi:uncharacterized membrane protein YccC
MLKKGAWIIPVNTAILFAILCYWAIQNHDPVWAVITIVACMVNVYFAYRWFRMRGAKSVARRR